MRHMKKNPSLNLFFLQIDKPWCWLMVVKLTSTPSMRLQIDGNALESLNTHHSCGMKYVDPSVIIYIIKTAQQPLSTELWSRERESRSTGRSHNDAQQPRHLFGSFVIPPCIISVHINCTFYQSAVVLWSVRGDSKYSIFIQLINFFVSCVFHFKL